MKPIVYTSALLLWGTFASFAQTLASPAAPAQMAAQADPDLPQPFDPSIGDSLLSSSPFTRSVNLSDSLVLTGIAYIEGKPVATILNKEKQESYVISELPSDHPSTPGWRLAETNATVQLSHTQAKIMIGGEVVTVRYSSEQLSPDAMKRPANPSMGNSGEGRGDRRDRWGGGSGRREGMPRPDEATRKRFEGLSDEGRRKLFEEMRNNRERMTNMSAEERKTYMDKALENAEKSDRKK